MSFRKWLLCWFPVGIWFLGPGAVLAQNDACRTVHPFTRSAGCQHKGAGCNAGSGPGTGHCVFLTGDRVCDCAPNSAPPRVIAVAQQGLSAPVFVNLYWDAAWDTDHPTMPQREFDAFTAAMIGSSYLGGLAEYGVQSASYGGGFLPAQGCPQKAPSRVGFYDPNGTSIMGFLQCELENGGVPKGSQVVYNIILPAGSLESDLFGSHTLCSPSPLAWHFHQTPYTDEGILGISLELLAVATGGVEGGLEALLGAVVLLDGGPVYTITSADPACGSLPKELLHEMVEAASDPFPPLSVITSGSGEIADVADDQKCPASTPFATPAPIQGLPASLNFPSFDNFTSAGTIQVQQYWSNAKQQCVAGSNSTMPKVLKIGTTGNGVTLSLTITGTGFGTLAPTSSAVPYIAIQNETQRWQAGNSLNSDVVTLNISSWAGTAISVNGFNFTRGNLVLKPKDKLSVWVCNPSSGICGAGATTLAESGAPQLKVDVFNATNVNLAYDLKLDGNPVAHAVPNGGSTGWMTEPGGSHVVSETPTVPGFVTPTFRDGCDANGNLSLKLGDNQICTIFNVVNTGCSATQHCCSNVNSKVGCSAGCVSSAVSCQALCPQGKNKCCGSVLPNGKCDGACVNSPKESCQ